MVKCLGETTGTHGAWTNEVHEATEMHTFMTDNRADYVHLRTIH